MTIRFIHAADLHLGSPFKGFSDLPGGMAEAVRESTFKAFHNLIDYAVTNRPDFLLIAGDIYDGENRSLKAQETFRKGMEKLHEAGVPVIVSHGNHDHLAGSWVRFSLPENVRVYGPEVETAELDIRGTTVKIHGFSYPERHVLDPVIRDYPQSTSGSIEIGMLHGSVRGDEAHDVYAPFTKDELLSKGYDYWALGHIHKRQLLNEQPPIVYPGNLQGLHRKESGVKGFYDVTLDAGQAELKFVPACSLVFGTINVDCTGIRHADEWIARCKEEIRIFREQNGPGIVDLRVLDTGDEAESLFADAPEEEWLAFIREAAAADDPDVGIHRLVLGKQAGPVIPGGLFRDVLDELERWDAAEWKDLLSDLYGHRQAYRFAGRLDGPAVSGIKDEAERLLIEGLAKGASAK